MSKRKAKIEEERAFYQLSTDASYLASFEEYSRGLASRKVRNSCKTIVLGVAEKNMLKALRMLPRLNTSDDWARLHATEIIAFNI